MEILGVILAGVNLVLVAVVLAVLSRSRAGAMESALRDSRERLDASLHSITAQQTDALARVREEVRAQMAEGLDRVGERLAASADAVREKLDTSLARNREEQAAGLQRVTQSMEGRFEGLRANVESRLGQVGEKVETSLKQGRAELSSGLDQATRNLEQRFGELRQATEQKLLEIRGEVEKKLGETVAANIRSFDAVAQRLREVHEATGQIVSLSKGVHDLNILLQTPKARGAFGELTLEQMLKDLFGEDTGLFEIQYSVGGSERVDAAIFLRPDRSLILCVDSKFPMANAQPLLDAELDDAGRKETERAFKTDVLNRAGEIAQKYIQPPRTTEFAFMFVPAESVYYLLLKNSDLHQRLLQMHVVPTSPNSFYAYLQALSIAFRGMKIEEKTRDIQRAISGIAEDFGRFAEDYRKLGGHLESAYKRYGDSQRRVEKFQARIRGLNLAELAPEGEETHLLDAPEEPPPPDEEV